jgi:hypothetical protein
MTERRSLTFAGSVTAAIGGAVSGTGALILTVSAATGGSFPFGAAFLVFAGGPFLLVGAVLFAVGWWQGRRSLRRP